jgi:arsenite methyltransferase
MSKVVVTDRSPDHLKSCCASLYELPVTSLILGPSFHPGGAQLTRKLAEAGIVGRRTRVLDVASGTGESARLLASHFGCEVVGVDYSHKNVSLASASTNDERVRFVEGDAEALPFDDETFDVVMCECALCTFPDMSTALAEMKRVLTPRGRVAISDVVLEASIPAALDNLMGHVLCITGALDKRGYVDALEQAGFTNVRYRDHSRVLRETIDSIEQRVDRAKRLAEKGEIELPEGLRDAGPTLRAARDYVLRGGAGYMIISGRR